MNILYLTFSFTTGGTERLLVDICQEMTTRHDNIYLYIINDHYDLNMIHSIDPKVKVTYGHKKPGMIGKIKAVLKLNKFIRKHKIDVVHCNAVNTLEMLFLKQLLFRKTKILYTIHCLDQFAGYKKKRMKYLNKICNQFIAISSSVKQNAIDLGIKEEKIKIVYNAINLNKFHGANEKPFDKMNVILGNVGRIVPHMKGQDILIEAVSLLKNKYSNIKCVFAGKPDKGEEQVLTNLQNLAKEKGVGTQCIFLGNVEDVEGFLKTIDIFVLPSRCEGFGISLIEALVLGIPCVSSNVDGPAEVSENGRNFDLFENMNVFDLANKIENVIENFERYKLQAVDKIEYIKEKYNIVTMCDLLEKEYK